MPGSVLRLADFYNFIFFYRFKYFWFFFLQSSTPYFLLSWGLHLFLSFFAYLTTSSALTHTHTHPLLILFGRCQRMMMVRWPLVCFPGWRVLTTISCNIVHVACMKHQDCVVDTQTQERPCLLVAWRQVINLVVASSVLFASVITRSVRVLWKTSGLCNMIIFYDHGTIGKCWSSL